MVSPDIQRLGLSDELLEHYKREVGEMALGILDGKPFDSPVHEGILLTCMLELLPYDDSDKSEFSESRLTNSLPEAYNTALTEAYNTAVNECNFALAMHWPLGAFVPRGVFCTFLAVALPHPSWPFWRVF